MAEYIKREAAIKAIEKADYTLIANDADSCESDYLREIIESVPTADVVSVVRCKNCTHLYGTVCTVCGLLPRKPNDFCSYGERRDGGADNASD